MPPARPLLTRRAALLGLTSAISLGPASLALAAAPVPAAGQRFVVVILRGALDGLAAVVPYGDSNLAAWRAELVPPQPGSVSGLLDLGGFYRPVSAPLSVLAGSRVSLTATRASSLCHASSLIISHISLMSKTSSIRTRRATLRCSG